MDVALGVAVTDRVARLALVDSAAPGTVIDQFVLDVAEHPVEVLTETVVGTDRSLAGENHRLVATRLCWPDQAKADELQHALQDSGVHDVAVISEAQAATALVGAAHAGSAVLLVGAPSNLPPETPTYTLSPTDPASLQSPAGHACRGHLNSRTSPHFRAEMGAFATARLP